MSTPSNDDDDDNGALSSSGRSLQLAFSPSNSPDVKLYLNVTDYRHCLLLFLASATVGAPAEAATLGSLVYALPNVH